MKKASIILQRDFRELRKTSAFMILVIAFALVTIAASLIIGLVLRNQEWLGQEKAKPMLELIVSLVVYFLSMSVLITFIWAFASFPVVKEKAEGNISSLLATPLSPKEILVGKSFAIFLPGLVISDLSTLIVLLAVNFIAIKPITGSFLFPVPVLFTGLFTNPVLFCGLLLFIILFSLINNPDIAISPSFIIGFGLMLGIPLGIATGVVNLASWTFSLWYLAGAAVVWIVVLSLSSLLTGENIVLSDKGGGV